MSSRQAEKERRRQERLAREADAAKAARQRQVMGWAAGGLLGLAAVVAIAIALTAGGGGGGGGGKPTAAGSKPKVPIPVKQVSDLSQAARAAGCGVRSFVPGPNDRQHVTRKVHYRQNPPVFGPHNPVPASDGSYAGQGNLSPEPFVHALEHGRVVIWYQASIGPHRVQQLETLLAEPFNGQQEGYKQLLVQHDAMPFQVAATAWGQQLGCARFSDKVFDALRAFRARYVDKGPETIPYPE